MTKAPFHTVEADWFDSDWTESSEGYEKTVNIDVFGKRAEFAQNMERLYSVVAVDAEENTYGQLYVNDTFLRCRIQSSKKESWKGYVYSEVELTFIAPELSWVTEVTRQFFPKFEVSGASGLDYPYDHPFDFAEDNLGVATWNIDHVRSSEFQMIMYGPCTNPHVLINNHAYAVYTDLEAGEYLIIDSRSSTIYKYLSNGTVENIFNERGLADSIFEPIPSGLLHINWSGEFGFDLTLFLERREARWGKGISGNLGDKPSNSTGDGGETAGLQLKTGRTSSASIDTGLSSIAVFGIAACNSATGVGLCNAMFNSYEDADHVNMSYCNSSSDYLKMYTYTASSSYFSISGGIFEWTGTDIRALQEGMEYQWFAIGT